MYTIQWHSYNILPQAELIRQFPWENVSVTRRGFWDSGMIQFLNRGAGYISVFTLWKFIGQPIEDLYIFICIYYTLINMLRCSSYRKRAFKVIRERLSTFLTGCSFIPPQTHRGSSGPPWTVRQNPVCSNDEWKLVPEELCYPGAKAKKPLTPAHFQFTLAKHRPKSDFSVELN